MRLLEIGAHAEDKSQHGIWRGGGRRFSHQGSMTGAAPAACSDQPTRCARWRECRRRQAVGMVVVGMRWRFQFVCHVFEQRGKLWQLFVARGEGRPSRRQRAVILLTPPLHPY